MSADIVVVVLTEHTSNCPARLIRKAWVNIPKGPGFSSPVPQCLDTQSFSPFIERTNTSKSKPKRKVSQRATQKLKKEITKPRRQPAKSATSTSAVHGTGKSGGPIQCLLGSCSVEFATSDSLKTHFVDFHGIQSGNTPIDTAFTCQWEGCGSTLKSSVLRHLMAHTIEYRCPRKGCESVFSRPTLLTAHMKQEH